MQGNAHEGSDAAPAGQPTQDLGSAEGQPTDEGQAAQAAEPTGVEGAAEADTPESKDYESMYKELQTEFGTRNETLKGFEDRGRKFLSSLSCMKTSFHISIV